jgi:hypothetical protein
VSSLKRSRAVDGDREKKRLCRIADAGGGEVDGGAPRLLAQQPLCTVASASAASTVTRSILPGRVKQFLDRRERFPDRLDQLPRATERKHSADDDACAGTRALTRVNPPPVPPRIFNATGDADCAFYVEEEEDGMSTDASLINWPTMFWCARVVRALLTGVFGYTERTFAVAWAPAASYKAKNRGAERRLVFNAALLAAGSDTNVAFYQTFVAMCHELTHDRHRCHDATFVAMLERRIASLLAVHGPEFAQKFDCPK